MAYIYSEIKNIYDDLNHPYVFREKMDGNDCSILKFDTYRLHVDLLQHHRWQFTCWSDL